MERVRKSYIFLFQELLLAEKWARLHSLPFPPIRETVKKYLDEPLRECYVFKKPDPENDSGSDDNDDDDEAMDCPVVIFFPLVNASFKEFKSPGVARETDDDKLFGDFKIFDETTAYAIWRFVYPNLSYDRLTAMMEYLRDEAKALEVERASGSDRESAEFALRQLCRVVLNLNEFVYPE